MKRLFLYATLAIGGIAGWLYFATPSNLAFGGLQDPNSTTNRVWLWVLGYLITLGGVACGSGYRSLQKLQGQSIGSVRKFFGGVLLSTDLWMGLLGSPIVYGLILRSTTGMSHSAFFVTALENGFCCTILINSFTHNGHRTPQPQAAANEDQLHNGAEVKRD